MRFVRTDGTDVCIARLGDSRIKNILTFQKVHRSHERAQTNDRNEVIQTIYNIDFDNDPGIFFRQSRYRFAVKTPR